MKAFLVFTLTETWFATTSYSWIFVVWSINYANLVHNYYILKMSRYTNIVYIGRYLVLTYIERFATTVCCFFSYICWSVNCMSWVSKFNNFFLTCTETEARFIFQGFNVWHVRKLRQDLYFRALMLSFMESSFLTPRYSFFFLFWSINCLRDFFSHFVSQ